MDSDLIDICDENDIVIGITTRKEAHEKDLYHRVVVVYLESENGDILLQRRADNGLLDCSSSGHVDAGESYEDAAKRELLEEVGADVSNLEEIDSGLYEIGQVEGTHRHFYKIFKGVGDAGELNKHEVLEVLWMKPGDVWEEMQQNETKVKYLPAFIDTLEKYLTHKNGKNT